MPRCRAGILFVGDPLSSHHQASSDQRAISAEHRAQLIDVIPGVRAVCVDVLVAKDQKNRIDQLAPPRAAEKE